MLRTILLMMIAGLGPVLALAGREPPDERPAPQASTTDAGFTEQVRPFLETYCLGCHGADAPKAGLDLSGYDSADSVLDDLALWEIVLEQLEAEAMPPPRADAHPDATARHQVIAWINDLRRLEAERNAGDPGPVPARRLSNAEYDHSIRDLTGVDLRPTRTFPVDPANEAGFDNSAESLTMSPALVKKYLDAAREVADHLVLTPDGLAFAPHPVIAATDRDKYSVNRIIDFYTRHEVDLADYVLAAWQYRHREALGRPDSSLKAIATDRGLSPRYLETVWTLLNKPPEAETGPIVALQALWDELPPPEGDDPESARPACERLRDVVVDLREQLTPEVENLTSRGISNGTQPFVLWKNRQMAANRMRYAGGAADLNPTGLDPDSPAALALAPPDDPDALARFEATFEPFCRVFPDAFVVTERARIYLDPDQDKNNTGRLLSAGFHSMTGYFRDDQPLYDLVLDDAQRQELDRLWTEFNLISDLPMRQFSSYLWYERAETGFMRGDPDFDFVRAEDRDAASEAKMTRLADVYLAKARRIGASDRAIQAIADQFAIISREIRRVERLRAEAEPHHVAALADLAERAYRRRLSPAERDGVAAFYQALRSEDGLDHEDAVRDTVVSILMSPHFLYRVDLPQEEGSGIQPLSPNDLASRLSYFLWASMPDDELMTLADSGELQDPEVLAAQARRMLRDDRVRGLATEFAGNWLDFRRFEAHNSVDRTRFPAFDDTLRRSMFEEPIRLFLDLVQYDRPVDDLLTGTRTFVNPPLARHYGIPIPEGGPDTWVEIADATPYGRGGLLPMAVFLTQNSPGLRTSPVKRGYWVVRRLLGEHIPPPPPDVPELPDDEADLGSLTLREALARHRADPACAVCHDRFDGIGVAFEGFGPVGELRTVDLGGRPVETEAEFPRGGQGTGVEGLRAYLEQERRDEFVENLCRKLLAYALGRTLIPSDDATIQRMQARLLAEEGRFGALVEAIVLSPQFRNTRVERDLAE
ncbi:DUF1592 domain-containing protein [Tautonia sp. JC769]|uniref:DUF1592 domain-containing protein n=1 Tax=Tautonia sp. JC769 TaxID=3232135 RepID=UPI003459434F